METAPLQTSAKNLGYPRPTYTTALPRSQVILTTMDGRTYLWLATPRLAFYFTTTTTAPSRKLLLRRVEPKNRMGARERGWAPHPAKQIGTVCWGSVDTNFSATPP